ncbi:transcriptional regulator, AbiEi antitoxin, type IV TA system (plasmid) [Campylobacter helveticus]|nr:type IV toxin-antitoxin system AbiEi family antitoxin domain-containing protein [Campylobacter helveticus]ARE81377.1 transcriptional regulator, AbiEi antitoxin, type IV TA system [Campylobacter helveticus]MCR2062070.1 type IV toxin-antitoxin system AbiEi family antitoxin domain-containing protein [Campylobacter helveticus]
MFNIKYTYKYILCRVFTMTQMQMIKMLDFLDSKETWSFDINFVCAYFRTFHTQNVKIALSKFTQKGLIERLARGLYANKRAKNKPYFALEHIASQLRDKTSFYLSLESLLSEEGLISQIPNRLTFISKNRTQLFNTPYGLIEFVYTKMPLSTLLDECYYDKERGVYVAKTQRAISDIYRHNRSVDLYEEQLRKDRGEY